MGLNCIGELGVLYFVIHPFILDFVIIYILAESCGSPYLFVSFQIRERKLLRASSVRLEPRIRLCIEMSQPQDPDVFFLGWSRRFIL